MNVHGATHTRRFSILAATTVALAVGASTGALALVTSLWWPQSTMARPSELVVITRTAVHASAPVDLLTLEDIEQLGRSALLANVAGQVSAGGLMADFAPRLTLADTGHSLNVLGVTSDYFSVLGVCVRGRPFRPSDDLPHADPVAIISDRLWRDAFGADNRIVGAIVESSRGPLKIVGLACKGFQGARLGEQVDLWIPQALTARMSVVAGFERSFQQSFQERVPFLAVGRMQPAVTLAEVQRDVARLAPGAIAYKAIRTYGTVNRQTVVIDEAGLVTIVTGAIGLVLVSAWLTLTTLVLVRLERQRGDLAIRLALGCERWRLRYHALTNCAPLAIGGGVGAVAVAWGVVSLMPSIELPNGIEFYRLEPRLGRAVLWFSVLSTLGIVGVAALVAVNRLQLTGLSVSIASGRSDTRSSITFRRLLLALHAMATVVIVVVASVLILTVGHGMAQTVGFDVERTVFASVRPSILEFYDPQEGPEQAGIAGRRLAALERARLALLATPGVLLATEGPSPIRPGGPDLPPLSVQTDRNVKQIRMGAYAVPAEYIDGLGLTVVAGRALHTGDAGTANALVTQTLADSLWPSEVPLGKSFSLREQNYVVVGVLHDFAQGSARTGVRAAMVSPGEPNSGRAQVYHFVIRTNRPAGVMAPAIAGVLADSYPNASQLEVQSGADLVSRDLGRERLAAALFSVLGLVALSAAMTSVFGLAGYFVETRRRELAVKRALGASRRVLLLAAVAPGMTAVAAGTVVGGVVAAALVEIAAAQVGILRTASAATYLAVAFTILCGATAASTMAASRIVRLNLGAILRPE